jgi:hypothetical protein
MKSLLFFSFIALFLSCSGLQNAEELRLRRYNATKEAIHRSKDSCKYPLEELAVRPREPYPFEKGGNGHITTITKEFFRCKGSSSHPPKHKDAEAHSYVYDCGGLLKHSLPIKEGREYVFPILIELLNDLQKTTKKKVVITCGHRCPEHNTYADFAIFNQSSKHMIAAEVDFYIQGMENEPEKVVQLIQEFYQKNERYKGLKDYQKFERLSSLQTNVTTPPWYNKEVLIKLYKASEGRDFDNQHPHPYISLQVRFDMQDNQKVLYSWDKAFKGFHRY